MGLSPESVSFQATTAEVDLMFENTGFVGDSGGTGDRRKDVH